MGVFFDALGAAAPNLIGAGANILSTWMTNNANKSINDANLDYNAAVQNKTWEREDSAWQRGVADAKAAGLSPLALTSGNSAGSIVGAPSAIPMQSSNAGALIAGSAGSLMNSLQLAERRRQFDAKMKQDDEHFKANLQRDYDALDRTDANLEKQINAAANERDKDRTQEAQHFTRTLNETIREFNAQYEENKHQFDEQQSQARFDKFQESVVERIKQVTGGKGDFVTYDDPDEYDAAVAKYVRDFENFIEMEYTVPTSTSKSYGESSGTSVSAGFGDGTSSSQSQSGSYNERGYGHSHSLSSMLGLNMSANASSGINSSQSGSYSENNSQYNDALLAKFFMKHPCPVYTGDIKLRESNSRSYSYSKGDIRK